MFVSIKDLLVLVELKKKNRSTCFVYTFILYILVCVLLLLNQVLDNAPIEIKVLYLYS